MCASDRRLEINFLMFLSAYLIPMVRVGEMHQQRVNFVRGRHVPNLDTKNAMMMNGIDVYFKMASRVQRNC